MAQYNRYVYVPHLSYNQWRANTLGNGYNVDYYARNHGWGNQCWDYCALLWWQYGLTLITKANGGTAYDCWRYSRYANARYPFTSVSGVQNIRRGDVIITKSPRSSTGHICFADENYRTSGDRSKLWCIGQNQRGSSSLPVTRDQVSIAYFVGLFRNMEWGSSSPEPEPEPESDESVYNESKYPWVLKNFNKKRGK